VATNTTTVTNTPTPVNVLRWGVLSTANIAKKVVAAMHVSPFATPVAVASRSLENAKEFAKLNNLQKAYGSYDELLNDPEIDAVYIPLPTGLRAEWVFKAARAGKHVLADKPIRNAEEVQLMRKECEKNNVLFMDNTMWLHHIRTYEIKEKVPMFHATPGTLGALQKARASFNYELAQSSPNNIRFDKLLEPYGALGDLGWYCIGNILFFFNDELPIKVWATADYKNNDKENGVIVRCDGILWFSHNRKASFDCSFIDCFKQDAEYMSYNSIVRINDFVIANEDVGASYTVCDGEGKEVAFSVNPHVQHVHLFNTFASLAQSPTSPEALSWGERTYRNMKVLDAIYQSAYEEKPVNLYE
jgi:xylose dehydrogenase (NAD/NADP)